MIINMANGIDTSKRSVKILQQLADSMIEDYQCAICDYYSTLSALLLTKNGSTEFRRWAKSRYGITLRYFNVPFIDTPSESVMVGYELTEDEYLTKFLLEKQIV